MLEILALNGPLTTWGMAKNHLGDNQNAIRTREKEYRRLLVGRKDRGKKSIGIMDVGLVVKDGKNYLRGPSDLYRLSLHGVLYCIDVLDLTNNQIDALAAKYAYVLPDLFGKWWYLKSIIGNEVYRIRSLAAGILLDNIRTTEISKFPVYEILTYISVKYQNSFEYIEEKDLANQISYWFYTSLLISSQLGIKTKISGLEERSWKKIFDGDKDLKKWYYSFLDEAIGFYEDRFRTVKHLRIK